MDRDDTQHKDWAAATIVHLDALYGFAMSLTKNADDAQELVQDTYAQASDNFDHLRPDSNLKAWLFVILRNAWRKQLRTRRSGPQFVQLNEESPENWFADTSQDPQDLYVRLWEREEIRSAIKKLPVESREIVILRDIEGFKYQEIAEILDCPLGTIMSRLTRSRRKLKEILAAGENYETPNIKQNKT